MGVMEGVLAFPGFADLLLLSGPQYSLQICWSQIPTKAVVSCTSKMHGPEHYIGNYLGLVVIPRAGELLNPTGRLQQLMSPQGVISFQRAS